MTDNQPLPSLEGRRFAAVADVEGGEVGTETVFTYHQAGDLVWGEYVGGRVELGRLVGSRSGDALDFRYVQRSAEGHTASGRCRSVISRLPDGRLRLDETWAWESREGAGTSAVEEIAGPPD